MKHILSKVQLLQQEAQLREISTMLYVGVGQITFSIEYKNGERHTYYFQKGMHGKLIEEIINRTNKILNYGRDKISP